MLHSFDVFYPFRISSLRFLAKCIMRFIENKLSIKIISQILIVGISNVYFFCATVFSDGADLFDSLMCIIT